VSAPDLVPLGGTGWRLWPDVALRSAGLPVSGVEGFCDPAVAEAADRAANLPATPGPESAGDRARYHAEFAVAEGRLSAAVRRAAADALLREAVAWQNPALVGTCLDKAARGESRNVRGRNHELAVAGYVQRYTHKNDTIGFFGPVGWASLDPGAPALEAEPGPGLLRRRTTYFEMWAVDAIADLLAARPDVEPWLVPALNPAATLNGRALHLPLRRPMLLDVPEALLLHLCDGTRSVRTIVAAATTPHRKRPTPAFAAPEAALAALRRLRDLSALRMDLRGPVHARPEDDLRRRLEQIPDPRVRRRALAPLAELVAARDAVDAAAGDAEKVLAGTEALGETFHRITGQAQTRRAGRTYAGRTLIYHDTVRDVRVRVGRPVLDALAAPLGLVLDSARWLTGTVAQRYHDLLAALVRRHDGALPLIRLIMVAAPDLTAVAAKTLPPPVTEVVADFQRRWARLLGELPQGGRHQVRVADVAELAAAVFPPLAPRWANARQHTPDLMIDAPDPRAVGRGDFQLVLGEIHLALNTLESRLFVEQHDDPRRLLALAERDAAGRRVYAVQRRSSPFVTSRVSPPGALLSPSFTYWTAGEESVECPAPPLRSADMTVHLEGDRLVVRTGGVELDLLEVIGEILTAAVANAFRPVPDVPHRPRITLDRLVLCRESWTVSAEDMRWAFVKDERDRFAAARAWITGRGIPDRVFVKVPVEEKPSLADFTSLVLVNALAKAIRRTAAETGGTVTLSEMLPGPNGAWLRDAEGNRYTSELRMVAVDHREAGR
jgi:Lantibiotic dehydratase, N terminus